RIRDKIRYPAKLSPITAANMLPSGLCGVGARNSHAEAASSNIGTQPARIPGSRNPIAARAIAPAITIQNTDHAHEFEMYSLDMMYPAGIPNMHMPLNSCNNFRSLEK